MADINEKLVRDAWAFMRQNNHDVPDFIFNLMRDAAIEKLSQVKRIKGLECPNCSNDTVRGIVLFQNGIEVDTMVFQCCACEWEWD